ncbi:MAG: hypothetical protein H0V80_12300 [Acidobacteria bacterium]|nr:hypothetical protein [Acidobacteriota bacterium]
MQTRVRAVLIRALVVLLPLGTPDLTNAQPTPTPPSPAAASTTAADLSWLVGHWTGTTAQGQHIEEMWMPARDGLMLGSFRWERDDHRWLFELLAIADPTTGAPVSGAGARAPGRLVLRLKHFDRQFRGLEAQEASTTLTLVEHTDDRVVFEMIEGKRLVRVGYTRKDADTLVAFYDATETGKPAMHIDFPYTRVK